MKRKTAIGSAIAAMGAGALLATGITGLATASPTTNPGVDRLSSSDGSMTKDRGPKGRGMGHHGSKQGKHGKNAVRGEHVIQGADGAFITYRMTHGTVTAVSPTSITVQAADGTSERYAINAETRVFKDRSTAAVSDITANSSVHVMGTVTAGTPTADKIHIRTS